MTVTEPPPEREDVNAQIIAIEEFETTRRKRHSKIRLLFFRKLCEAELDKKFQDKDDHTVGTEIYDEVRAVFDRPNDYTSLAPGHLLHSVMEMLRVYYSSNAAAKRAKAKEVLIVFNETTYRPSFRWTEPVLSLSIEEDVRVLPKFPYAEIGALISQCKRFTACIAWFPHLTSWTSAFQSALREGASMKVLLAHPDSEFAKSRGDAATHDSRSARRFIRGDRENFRTLLASTKEGDQLAVWLTHRVLPLSYLEIDNKIYFSGFWSDRMSIDGVWFSTSSDSYAGKFLADQFDLSLTTAIKDDLTKPLARGEETALLDYLVSNIWVGTMQDVFRDDGSALSEPEQVTLSFQNQYNAEAKGLLHIEREDKPDKSVITMILRNAMARDRHVCFACENQESAVRHVGVILIEIDDSAVELRGFYLGWSPSRTHHCQRITFRKSGI